MNLSETNRTNILSFNQSGEKPKSIVTWLAKFFSALGTDYTLLLVVNCLCLTTDLNPSFVQIVLKLRGSKVLTFLVLILTRSGKRHRVTSVACHGYRSPRRSWELFAHDTPSIMWTNGEGRNKGNMSSIKHKIKTKITPCEKNYDFEHFHQTWCCTSRTDSRQRFTRVKFPDDQFNKGIVSITRIPYILDLTPNPE